MTSSECSKTAMRFSVYEKGKYGTSGGGKLDLVQKLVK